MQSAGDDLERYLLPVLAPPRGDLDDVRRENQATVEHHAVGEVDPIRPDRLEAAIVTGRKRVANAQTAGMPAREAQSQRISQANCAEMASWSDRGALRVYVSSEAHSSIEKGAKIAGFGARNVVTVAVDDRFAMDPAALEERIIADRDGGLVPCCIVATVGTTSSTAIDPLKPIGEIARKYGLWLHVDAALAGSAAILPEMRHLIDGIEDAHSFVFNPHKWLFTNFDCSAFFCREPETLVRTLTIMPEYLETAQDREVTNYRDWGIPLGRRFRSLKLWFVLRSFGVDGLRQRLRAHLALARDFERWIDESADFEVMAPVPVQTVCFRFNPFKGGEDEPDESRLEKINERLLDEVNRSGRIFITHTRLGGRFCLRLSVGQIQTGPQHVKDAWHTLRAWMIGRVSTRRSLLDLAIRKGGSHHLRPRGPYSRFSSLPDSFDFAIVTLPPDHQYLQCLLVGITAVRQYRLNPLGIHRGRQGGQNGRIR